MPFIWKCLEKINPWRQKSSGGCWGLVGGGSWERRPMGTDFLLGDQMVVMGVQPCQY